MAKYTMELRSLIKLGYPIFDDSWSTFVPEHKRELCEKIKKHYWFYEIGSETPERFVFGLNEQLALIMPYYNQLYASELLKIEPLYNQFLKETEGSTRKRDRSRGTGKRTQYDRLQGMADSIKKLINGQTNSVGVGNMKGNETWSEDRTVNTDETVNQTSKEHTDQTTESEKAIDTTGKEVMVDTTEGTKVTDGTSKTVTSSERRYSDTPQGQVSTSGVEIEKSYLTNYTKETGQSDVTTHEDQTITNTENRTTDTTKNQTEKETDELAKDITGSSDETKTVTTKDSLTGKRDKGQTVDDKKNETTQGTEKEFSNRSINISDNEVTYVDETEKEGEGESKERELKGFTVSQSQLLEEYRRTFLNIDAMIIKDLAINFMGIF